MFSFDKENKNNIDICFQNCDHPSSSIKSNDHTENVTDIVDNKTHCTFCRQLNDDEPPRELLEFLNHSCCDKDRNSSNAFNNSNQQNQIKVENRVPDNISLQVVFYCISFSKNLN